EPMLDSYSILIQMLHSKGGNAGVFNWGGWSYPEIDRLTDAAGVELDREKRLAMQTEALKIAKDEIVMMPLHQQPMAWAVASGFTDFPQFPDNKSRLWYVTKSPSQRTGAAPLRCPSFYPEALMLAFLIKRAANAIFVMLSVSFIAFMIFRFVGDPVELMLNEPATQSQRDELRSRLGLDQSFIAQFATFVGNAAKGDFGISFRNQQDVMAMIAERFPATFELVLVATFISLVVGIPMGVITAIRRQTWYAET